MDIVITLSPETVTDLCMAAVLCIGMCCITKLGLAAARRK